MLGLHAKLPSDVGCLGGRKVRHRYEFKEVPPSLDQRQMYGLCDCAQSCDSDSDLHV
jgi:hypothetical protein